MTTDKNKITTWKKAKLAQKYPRVQDSGFKDLEHGLSILKISKEEYNEPWVSAEEISSLLVEVFDLPATSIGITRAFAKAGGKNKSGKPILSKKENSNVFYKLSYPGENFINSVWNKGTLNVLYLKPNTHSDAHESLKDLIFKLKGKELNIIDPYYGVNSFKVIEEMLRAKKSVKFLSYQTNENSAALKREVAYLKRHYGNNIEFRIYPKKELHDRYILSANSVIIVGQGIKDLGNKESLIIVVDDKFGKDIRKILEKSFWERWKDPATQSL